MITPERRIRVDVLFPRQRLAIFVDGCFWHGCSDHMTWPKANAGYWRAKIERNRERDRAVDAALENDGWRVIRLWEHDDLDQAANQIRGTVTHPDET